MNKTYIKDNNNRIIGSVATQHNITRLYNSNNSTIATYNSKTNVTANRDNKSIGTGNQLLRVRL